MKFSDREEELITMLIRLDDYVNAKDLADALGVSSKTVYRLIDQINKKASSRQLIVSIRGRGLKIDYDLYVRDKNEMDKAQPGYSPIERRNNVLLALLFKAPIGVKLNELFKNYYVSDSVINGDLATLNTQLKKYGLVVERVGKRVSIVGDEAGIRSAISDTLIKENLMSKEGMDDFLDGFVRIDSFDKQFLLAQLELIENELKINIPYPYNINVFSHLYILMTRFRNGKVAETQQLRLTKNQEVIIEQNSDFYTLAKVIIANVSEHIHTSIPDIEEIYLLQYLLSIRYDRDVVEDYENSQLVNDIVDYYVDGFNFRDNKVDLVALKKDLSKHVYPMLNRIENNITVVNHLLRDISFEYPDVVEQIRKLSGLISNKFSLKSAISDDEVGFITLYFARYLEQVSHLKKAIIMCASGFGTSQLLKVKVQKYFPSLRIVDVLSKDQYLMHQLDYLDTDVVITTIDVIPQHGENIILVSSMFTKADRERVEKYLNG